MNEFRPLFQLVLLILRIFIKLACRIDAPGLDRLPLHGPLIVISNHSGQIEVPLLYTLLQPRKMTAWAKVETWDNWFLHWVFDLWGIIPIHRGEADMKALRQALDALKSGAILGVAPEGTRNKSGRLLRAQPGTVLLAQRSGAPILPLAHWGGESFLGNLKKLRRTNFHIRVGEPFRVETEGVRMTSEIRQEIADEMMMRLAALLPTEFRGEYEAYPERPAKYLRSWTAPDERSTPVLTPPTEVRRRSSRAG